MRNIRIIPRLDIKGDDVINTIQLEGLRKVGTPNLLAKNYYHQGADELLIIDQVASLYKRDHLIELIKKFVKEIFIPITVGGGIKSIEDARMILRSGADKIAVNTAAVEEPKLISRLAKEFGKQCVVVSIPCKLNENGSFEVFTNGGREKTSLEAIRWAEKAISLGAGELLVTSIDNDGLRNGYDLNLMKKFSAIEEVPIIASGGLGKLDHLVELLSISNCQGLSSADFLHTGRGKIMDIKNFLSKSNFAIRS